MSLADELETQRNDLIEELEERRLKLGISKRRLNTEAKLGDSYYSHWLRGAFQFPTSPKLKKIREALSRLEKVQEFAEQLREAK